MCGWAIIGPPHLARRVATTVRCFLDWDNEVQPDAYLRIIDQAGGSSRETEDDYLQGPPELIVEIAGSSVNYDLHQKKETYRRSGVQEYVVWRTEEHAIDWWQLDDGDYTALIKDSEGILRSLVFPGLTLDAGALLDGRLASVLARLQREIDASSDHASFAETLMKNMRPQ